MTRLTAPAQPLQVKGINNNNPAGTSLTVPSGVPAGGNPVKCKTELATGKQVTGDMDET